MAYSYRTAQPLGILDGARAGYSVFRETKQPFTHNPYWYEGFNPAALRGYTPRPAPVDYGYWAPNPIPASRVVWSRATSVASPMVALRTANLRNHLAKLEAQRDGFPCFAPQVQQQTSDESSDRTLGYSDSDRSDSGNETKEDTKLEAQLVRCILEYFGDCKGSLPSERVQNVIKKDHAELYEAVVVGRFRKKWHKFLQHCSDTFILFTRPADPAPNQDYCWRIRITGNTEWEQADQEEEELRAGRDREMLNRIHTILGQSGGQCSMMDVINELNKDIKSEEAADELSGFSEFGGRKARKIRAGDLKRLMRKCNSQFIIVESEEGEPPKPTTYLKLI